MDAEWANFGAGISFFCAASVGCFAVLKTAAMSASSEKRLAGDWLVCSAAGSDTATPAAVRRTANNLLIHSLFFCGLPPKERGKGLSPWSRFQTAIRILLLFV